MGKKEIVICPKCGSTRVEIKGVLQRKHGAWYYLNGGPIADAGVRMGNRLNHAVTGNKNDAKCLNCKFEWTPGKENVPAASTAAGPAKEASPVSRPKYCRACGTAIEPGDMYCVQCGRKL
ncbi:MAG: hypothetical protein IJX90_02845 [Blautia sp.]|nr:hypothetical protein [Blautia sp.]